MIEFQSVTKRYSKTVALNALSLRLTEDKIYCLLGRNGAGKTTFLNLIAGKIPATSGQVLVEGQPVSPLHMPRQVSCFEAAQSQFNLKVGNLIKLASSVNPQFDQAFAQEMMRRFQLDQKKKYKQLSFGMRTMVTTLLSLASQDKIILLDEPVLGFDAVMRAQFYELLSASYAAHPRIIIVSTHLIDEIANVAQQVIAIDHGNLLFCEDINTLLEKGYKVTGPTEEVKKATKQVHVVASEEIGKFMVAYVFDNRIQPRDCCVEVSEMSLQELFTKMVGGTANE